MTSLYRAESRMLVATVLGIGAVLSADLVPLHAALTHRYDFATNGDDLVGSADWSVSGATFAGGEVHFDGIDDFLSLSSTPLPTSGSSNMSIEVWGTYDPATAVGSRIFDFSTVSGNGGFYQYLTPLSLESNTQWRYDDGFGVELGPINQGSPGNSGQEILYTLTFDRTVSTDLGMGEMRLYRNGVLVASDEAESIPILTQLAGTTSNRLGHGESVPGDEGASAPAFLTGSINEFRVYDHALNATEILTNAVSGPDVTSVSFVDKNWIAGASNWNTGGNWNAAGVPMVTDRAVISNGGTASVNTSAPDVGAVTVTSGSLSVGSGGALSVAYPIRLGTAGSISVSGGGVLGTSGFLVSGGTGAQQVTIDGGILQASAGTAVFEQGVAVVVGSSGATFDSQSGTMSFDGDISGSGDIVVDGANVRVRDERTEIPNLQNPGYSGTWRVSNSVLDIQGSHGALGTGDPEVVSKLDISDSTLLVNTAVTTSVNFKRVPVDMQVGGHVELINTAGFDNTFRFQGSLSGDGTVRYTVPFSPTPIGLDFENRDNPLDAENPLVIDNSSFTGRFVVDDDTAVRFRTELSDLPNGIFDMAGDGAWTAKRGTDENQVIQLGGLAGVGPDAQLQLDSGGVAGYGSRLEASIAGSGDVGGFTPVTYEIGGASQDAEYFGIIRDTPFDGGHDVVTVVKVGDNTQAFSGANSYSGTTTVNAGTLLINGSHAQAVVDAQVSANDPANYDGLPVGDYTVNSGGALGGTGVIGSSSDLVNVDVLGGTLAPGSSAGTLTLNGNYTQDSSSTLAIEIGGTTASGLFDLFNISGSASLAGMLDVSIIDSPALSIGDEYTVLTAASVSGGTSLSLVGSASAAFSLDGSSGNSLVLTYLGGGMPDVDLDNDGDVDGVDFLLIQRTDPSLLAEWQQQYGASNAKPNVVNVPEPISTVPTLWIVLTAALSRCRGLRIFSKAVERSCI